MGRQRKPPVVGAHRKDRNPDFLMRILREMTLAQRARFLLMYAARKFPPKPNRA